jgi:hypothetical protein
MIKLFKWENSSISESFLASSNQVIYQGTALKKVKDATTGNIMWSVYADADRVAGTAIEGLALDSNQIQPIINPNGSQVGDGMDFPNFNRGGYIAAVQKNALLQVYNGPLDTGLVYATTYVVGQIVYWDGVNARFTSSSSNTVAVGIIEDFLTNATGAVVSLKIRLTL